MHTIIQYMTHTYSNAVQYSTSTHCPYHPASLQACATSDQDIKRRTELERKHILQSSLTPERVP